MAAPSFFKFVPGRSRELTLVFSQCFVAPGQFAIERTLKDYPHPTLFLNTVDNDFYQHGVPTLGTSVEETVQVLKASAQRLSASHIRCVGMSMGASAAILFGALLNADCVVAVGPELQIGLPCHRSHYHNRDRRFVAEHQDLVPHALALGPRLQMTFPAYDLGDWLHAGMAEQAGLAYHFMRQFHSGGQSIDWPGLLGSSIDRTDLASHLTTRTTGRISLELLRQGASAHEAFCRREHARACDLAMAVHAAAPLAGLAFFIAANLFCQNRVGEADDWLRRALVLDEEGHVRPARFDYDYSHFLPNRERALMRERLSILRGLSRG
ncbi:hypothetical protein [Rhizobium sp. SSA_523]|uniref:hypothetical protein n=1 Tax=Rhizobium sp. SSA_523 TaxID=2952477 RepID=UPI0020909AD5|nr:hypothetical protein [Rhizobium sp. SSA_523]MCO5730373.1 hypothetical protein [Rhizobium sp. SSA_523]WKC25417.1 hypothetical protein QTJ18_15755 [Rhizobium sp. SSA_523]